MKIQLERKLSACPDQMTCLVCHEPFWVRDIRTLLYSNNKLLQGDVCQSCMKLKPAVFQQKLRNQANRFIQQSILTPQKTQLLQDRAVELLETSEENITYPTMLHWVFKTLAIIAEGMRELEMARHKSVRSLDGRRSLRIDNHPTRAHLLSPDEN